MPRQNRVTPFGTLIATPERGTFMGNRGRLHDHGGRIQRDWQVKRGSCACSSFAGGSGSSWRPIATPSYSFSMKRPASRPGIALALSAVIAGL